MFTDRRWHPQPMRRQSARARQDRNGRLCGLLTEEAQTELGGAAVAQGLASTAPSCEQAGAALTSGLPESIREVVGSESPEREVSIDGAEAEASYTIGGITEVTRLREEARPLIDDLADPGASSSDVLRTMFDRAAAAEKRFADRVHELFLTRVGGAILAKPAAAATRRAAMLDSVAGLIQDSTGYLEGMKDTIDEVNRAYDEAFSDAGMDLCQTARGLTAA
jgi:hypothetical protein